MLKLVAKLFTQYSLRIQFSKESTACLLERQIIHSENVELTSQSVKSRQCKHTTHFSTKTAVDLRFLKTF